MHTQICATGNRIGFLSMGSTLVERSIILVSEPGSDYQVSFDTEDVRFDEAFESDCRAAIKELSDSTLESLPSFNTVEELFSAIDNEA